MVERPKEYFDEGESYKLTVEAEKAEREAEVIPATDATALAERDAQVTLLRNELMHPDTASRPELVTPPNTTIARGEKKPWYERWSKGLAKFGVSAIKSPGGGVKLIGKGFLGTIIGFLGNAVLLLQALGGKKMTDPDQLSSEGRGGSGGHGGGSHGGGHGGGGGSHGGGHSGGKGGH